MAAVSEKSRQTFAQKSTPYIDRIKKILKKEAEVLHQIETEAVEPAQSGILLCNEMVNAVSLFLAINSLSEEMLKMKNKAALEQGRKTLLKAVGYLESVVTGKIDVPYSDYAEAVSKISQILMSARLLLIRKLGFALDLMIDAFRSDSKLRWTFVELQGRFAAVAKNILDMKQAIQIYFSSTDENYGLSVRFFALIKRELSNAATEYYTRFSTATNSPEDIRLAISFLGAHKRICVLLNESEEVENLNRKIAVWQNTFELSLQNS
jgi:hypothetical protein